MASFSPDLPDLSGYSLPNQTVDRFSALDFHFSEAQKPADYFSRKLFEQPIVFIRAVVINQASAGNRPRRLQAPELVSSVHCSASSDIETDVSDSRRTFCSNVGTSAFSSASTPAQRASAASLQPPQLENLRCDPAALPAHQSRMPSADKSAPWRCGRFPAPPQAAAEQIDSQLPTEPALRRG